jgi:two-component system, LuxR family, response regulator FixJ
MPQSRLPTFIFSNAIRFANLKMLAETMASKSNSATQRFIVAVVDDDAAVCSSLKFSLELEGFAVRTYADGAEFLAANDLGAFSCLVIDQRMPAMSGMELIATLRAQQVRTPAILVVSHPNPALSARAAVAGVPIVEKPLLGNALVERIREACAAA